MKDKHLTRLITDLGRSKYGNPLKNSSCYNTFYIRKKSGGWRKIFAPEQQLKRLLKRLTTILYKAYQPTDCAMGFIQGRSIVSNASIHIGREYVFSIDLKNFFSSISYQKVLKIFQNEPFGRSSLDCQSLAGLCCIGNPDEKDINNCFLPQGSPASPILTNFICKKLDEEIKDLATRNDIHFSRYADDLSFSGDSDIFYPDGTFYHELKHIIESHGFLINEKKTRLQRQSQRQDVTGLTVNQKANISKGYLREIRSLLYIWERFGYEAAETRYRKKHKSGKELLPVLKGKILYMKMAKGNEDPTFLSISKRFNEIKARTPDCQKKKAKTKNEMPNNPKIIKILKFSIIGVLLSSYILATCSR
ncbi:MAG: reverse transcriptase family protein [Paludibacteraceae bacterium]